MTLLFCLTFFLSTGQPIHTCTPAIYANQKPIRSMERCKEEADAQRERFMVAFEQGNGMFVDVVIECKRKK